MKKIILVIVGLLSSVSVFAMDCKGLGADCVSAQAVVEVLNSDKTPDEAKNILIQILAAPNEDVNHSILSNEVVDSALGKSFRSIKIGYDDLTDDDNGYSSVYEIMVETKRDAKGNDVIVNVTFELIAG